MLLLYSQFLKKSLQFAIFFIARCLDFETFCILFVWSLIHSIGIFFFAGRKCVDLVVIFNKGREETLTLIITKSQKLCLTLVRPRKLIATYFKWCKMHITLVSLKNYSFHNFLNRSNFAFVCFFSRKIFSQKCLHHGTYLNGTSNVFAYLLIIFLGHDWFGFFLNKWGCIRSTP